MVTQGMDGAHKTTTGRIGLRLILEKRLRYVAWLLREAQTMLFMLQPSSCLTQPMTVIGQIIWTQVARKWNFKEMEAAPQLTIKVYRWQCLQDTSAFIQRTISAGLVSEWKYMAPQLVHLHQPLYNHPPFSHHLHCGHHSTKPPQLHQHRTPHNHHGNHQ